jgi:hypothetical protein
MREDADRPRYDERRVGVTPARSVNTGTWPLLSYKDRAEREIQRCWVIPAQPAGRRWIGRPRLRSRRAVAACAPNSSTSRLDQFAPLTLAQLRASRGVALLLFGCINCSANCHTTTLHAASCGPLQGIEASIGRRRRANVLVGTCGAGGRGASPIPSRLQKQRNWHACARVRPSVYLIDKLRFVRYGVWRDDGRASKAKKWIGAVSCNSRRTRLIRSFPLPPLVSPVS